MKLFGDKNKKTKSTLPVKSKENAPAPSTHRATPAGDASSVLRRPHITEKAAQLTARDVYTFEVFPTVTKRDVKNAIIALYKVTPLKIAIVKTPKKTVRLRTRRGWGTKGGIKKALVYLKKGDRIEFSS